LCLQSPDTSDRRVSGEPLPLEQQLPREQSAVQLAL
jgi:hypothetical protein